MKLLVAGFDGLDSQLFEATELPTLKEMRELSLWGTLWSAEMETGASWTTILTGWLAATHGLKGFMGARAANEVRFYNRPRDYIFDVLAEADFRVGVINFPTLDLPRAVGEGCWMVGGWPYEPRAYPGTIRVPDDYFTDLPGYVFSTAPHREPTDRPHHDFWWPQQVVDADEYFAFVKGNQRRQVEIAAQAPEVDVLMLQCSVMDRAGHLLTHHPDYGGLGAAHEAYERFLGVVDSSLTHMLELFSPELVALVSDHGFRGRSHSPTGVWALRGPDVVPLRLDTDQENFTPTVLDAVGLSVVRDGTSVLLRVSEQARQADVLKALGYV